MNLPLAEIFEVASFYAHFDIVRDDEARPPAHTIRVCDSLTCEMMGAKELLAGLEEKLGDKIRVVAAPCMGRCEAAPVADQLLHQRILRAVGILIFIDQHVANFIAPLVEDVGVLLKQQRWQQDQIVEVQGVIGFQCFLVANVSLGAEHVSGAFRLSDGLLGHNELVFPMGNTLLDTVRLIAVAAVFLNK